MSGTDPFPNGCHLCHTCCATAAAAWRGAKATGLWVSARVQERTSLAAMAALAGIGGSYQQHQITLASAIPLAVGALCAFVVPDKPGVATAAEKLAADAIVAEQSGKLAASADALANDAAKLNQAVEASATK